MPLHRNLDDPTRRRVLGAATLTGLLSVLGVPLSFAASYPSRPIKMVAPFSAGGPNDILARTVAEALQHAVKQPVIVENVTGAGGIVGTQRVLSSPPDGYTLLVGAAYLVTSPHLYRAAKFDPARDFVPLGPPVESLLVLVSGPHTDLKAMIERAKSSGSPLRIASPGTGTLSHLGGELLRMASGAPIIHAAYRGVGPALSDVIGGHADLMIDGVSSSLPLIRDGRLKALAVPDQQRNPLLPDVPTLGELGYRGVEVRAWNAIFAPASTPKDVIDFLTPAITGILSRAEIVQQLKARGMEPTTLTAASFRERLARESQHWKSVIQTAGVAVE